VPSADRTLPLGEGTLLRWKSEIARSALKKTLPFKPLLRRLKRRVRPYSPACVEHRIAVQDGIKLIEMLRDCDFNVAGKVGLEIGTGWVPTIPIIHSLCGVERFYLADVVRYMDEHTFNLAKQNILLHADLSSTNCEYLNIPYNLGYLTQEPSTI
jgi:hypothetical protein